MSLTASQHLKIYLMKSVVILMNIFDIDNVMCQHVKDLHNPLNQCFPNEQCMMLQNHTKLKYPVKM